MSRYERIPSVSVVMVSYDSSELVWATARVAPWAEVVVVEQHAGSQLPEQVRKQRPDARVVRAGANRGFGAGCNLGAANATSEILVFLNPDATIDEDSLLQLAVRALEDDSGVVGPTIRDSRGAIVTRAQNWTKIWLDALHLLWPRDLVPLRWQREIPATDPRYATGGEVAYVQGACMAVSRKAFFEAGGFDEQFFLYGEEEDLARRLRAQGRTSVLLPSATATHIGRTTTSSDPAFSIEQLFRSHVVLYRKYYGHPRSWLGALLLAAALLILLATAPLRRITPWRQRETPAWCLAGLRGVVAGLRAGAPVTPPVVSSGDEPWP